ncbi:MAG: hypothetical protein JO246_00945 [Frankiaceae bacterium]|nr:hypothetical protein [Frankiaceae bacterium]MBV9869682.1 hypothetical protein [Frankiaceae bacterium]
MTANHIRVSGKPKKTIDADLLVQAILMIAEKQLRGLQIVRPAADADTNDRRESA